MKMNRTIRCRMLGVLLACLLAIGVTSPVQAATAKATTMKLESTTGKVNLTTQNGTARKITKGMRLYNGYTLETAASSYAYISLDSSKAVKLDASSKAALRQSGKKLELLVKSGKLFFNVKTPLTNKESMNVRTSTMVTGVRGTCGVVEAVSGSESKLYLLEGKVICRTVNKETGKEENIEVVGGQAATFSTSAETGKEAAVETMSEEDIPLFAIEEVVKDTQLQDKIESLTDLDVNKMAAYLEQQSGNTQNGDPDKNDDTQSGDNNQGDDTQDGDSKNDGSKPSGSQPSNPSGPSSPGSSTPGVTPTYPNNPGSTPSTPSTPTPPPTPVTPTDPTPEQPEEPILVELYGEIAAAQVQDAWGKADIVKIAEGGRLSVTAADKLTIQNKKQLQIASGASLVIAQEAQLTVQSSRGMQVQGIVENNGTIVAEAMDAGQEDIVLSVASGAQIVGGKLQVVKGEVSNEGTIRLNSLTADGADGKIYNNGIIKAEPRDNTADVVSVSDYAYTSGQNGVLYSTKELLNEQQNSVVCNETILLASEGSGYYYVRKCPDGRTGILSENMAQLMREANADAKYKFVADAQIPEQQSIVLNGFAADMGENGLLVKGELVLNNVIAIQGSGSAVIRMQGGTLKLEGDEPGNIVNENNTSGYVIATSERGNGRMIWKNRKVNLESSNVENTIEGVTVDGTNDVAYTVLGDFLNIDADAKIRYSQDAVSGVVFLTQVTND